MPLAKSRSQTRKIRALPPLNPDKVFRRSNAGVRTLKLPRQGNTKELVPLLSTKRSELFDPFDYSFDVGIPNQPMILEPELPYGMLLKAAKANSALPQCIDAYVINIEAYGYQLEFVGTAGSEGKPRMQAEKVVAQDFLDNCTEQGSLRIIRENRRKDLEYLGAGYFEIGRDLSGRPTYINHVPSVTVRKTRKDKAITPYKVTIRSADGTITTKTWQKRFRRYVQIGPGGQRIYFKEFGDPRAIDPANGLVNDALAIEDQATEIFEEEIYSPGSVYGQPRWIGVLPDMLCLRESEVVNLNFFRENAIPAMAVLISGGALTEESYNKVVNVINAAKGHDAMNRIMILEAAADDSVGDADKAPPAPRIELKPLGTERQSDALFTEAQSAAKKKIRSAMRLPALYTGDTDEYTKATAHSGLRVAEGQVFAPERSKFDEFINNKIFPPLGITNWKFRTLGPSVYDPDTLSVMIDRFGRQGAMTPNVLIKIANQVLDVQIEPVTDEWGNVPFTYITSMAAQGLQLKGFSTLFENIINYTVRQTDLATDAGGNVIENPDNANIDGGDTAKPPANDTGTAPAAAAKGFKVRRQPDHIVELRRKEQQVRSEINVLAEDWLERIREAGLEAVDNVSNAA